MRFECVTVSVYMFKWHIENSNEKIRFSCTPNFAETRYQIGKVLVKDEFTFSRKLI